MRVRVTFELDLDVLPFEYLSKVAAMAENFEGQLAMEPTVDDARLVAIERVPERDRHG